MTRKNGGFMLWDRKWSSRVQLEKMGVQILRQGRETEEGEKKWGVKVLRWKSQAKESAREEGVQVRDGEMRRKRMT